MSEWFDLKEISPGPEGQYIVATMIGSMAPKRQVRAGMWRTKGHARFMTSDWEYVTHWQPLPEPPEEA